MGDSKLQSRVEKEEEELQWRETLPHVDTESKNQRRLQEESREKFLSKLEEVVTPEGFVYYVDNSSANDGGDDYLPISNSDHEVNDNEEAEFPSGQNEFVGCTKDKNSDCLDLMAPEFSYVVEGGEIYMRKIESIHRILAESRAEDNLRANLNKEIDTVIQEVSCIVEKRGCVSSREKEESFRNKHKISKESNGSVCPPSINCGPGDL